MNEREHETIAKFVAKGSGRYGLITAPGIVQRDPPLIVNKAFLDGIDITERCTALNDKEGWVELIGDPIVIVDNNLVRNRHYGIIRLEIGPYFDQR